jgi:hypothetical protein
MQHGGRVCLERVCVHSTASMHTGQHSLMATSSSISSVMTKQVRSVVNDSRVHIPAACA